VAAKSFLVPTLCRLSLRERGRYTEDVPQCSSISRKPTVAIQMLVNTLIQVCVDGIGFWISLQMRLKLYEQTCQLWLWMAEPITDGMDLGLPGYENITLSCVL